MEYIAQVFHSESIHYNGVMRHSLGVSVPTPWSRLPTTENNIHMDCRYAHFWYVFPLCCPPFQVHTQHIFKCSTHNNTYSDAQRTIHSDIPNSPLAVVVNTLSILFLLVLAGLGLRTEELTNAFLQIKFNIFVQCFNFGVVSSIAYGVSHILLSLGAISEGLADGMVVCASLPLTINMVLVLTKSSGGDEAAAIFNAAFGNLIGVFLSPVLILGYNGVTGRIDLPTVFLKLSLRVVRERAVH